MKTTIYIDGYNLYYGALNKSAYKWLDVVKLFSHICHENNPKNEIVDIKFFTSPVRTKYSTHGELAQKSQKDYHKALKKLYPTSFKLIEGYFLLSEGWFPKYQKPIDRMDTVKAYHLEEKQTDIFLYEKN